MRAHLSAMLYLLLAAVLCAVPLVAAAEENGLLIGASRLHLGIGVESGYDNNVTYAEKPVSDVTLHVKPMLRLIVPSETIAFEIGGTLDVLRYFGTSDSSTSELSTVQGLAATRAVFNPKGKFVFYIKDDFARSSDPRNDILGTFAHTSNLAGTGFDWKPGGGNLNLNVGYSFYFDFFDAGTGLTEGDSYAQQPALNIKWSFFPKTALLLGASGDLRRYPNTGTTGDIKMTNVDMNAIRAYAGVAGMITNKLSMNIRAGYGNTLATTAGAKNFQSVVALAEFQYDLTATTRFTLSYARDFQPAPIYGFYGTDRIRASATQEIFRRLTLVLDGGVDLQDFGDQSATTGIANVGSRKDVLTSVLASIDYQILSTLTVGVSDNYQLRSSSFSSGGSSSLNKNVALLKVTYYY